MCGRFAQRADPKLLASRLGVAESHIGAGLPPPRYNIAPSQAVMAVRLDSGGERELVTLTWGLVPAWSKEPKTPYSTINARAETVDTKPAFRHAFRKHRCVIPADGYYEWQQTASGKQPWYLTASDEEGFAFAGLWERWQAKDAGPDIESCTIIVTGASVRLRPIHDRMPVILPVRDIATWLSPDTPAEGLKAMLKPCAPETTTAWPVSTWVNSPRHDDARCIDRVTPAAVT
jgi:putative SOS response-associated peptidase YedK